MDDVRNSKNILNGKRPVGRYDEVRQVAGAMFGVMGMEDAALGRDEWKQKLQEARVREVP